MTQSKWFASWLWVCATLAIIHILWTCQQHLPPLAKNRKIKFTSLSLSTHEMAYLLWGFDCVFKSLLATSQNLPKIITKAANPDLQIRKYSLIYELYKLGITNETSSLITGYSPPAHLSPLAPCGQLRNPVRDEITATQPHSPWQLGSWHWTLAPRPATEPHCLAVSIDVMSSQMQSWSLKCFWWNPIPENHLESLHWWGLCRYLSIFWELFFKCGETLGFTQFQIQNERWDLAYGLQIGQALLLPVPMGIEEISAPPCSLHHYSH